MLENLKPEKVFYYFEEISKIPRSSGNEKQISDYLVNFATSQGLDYTQDKALNVIIRKPGSTGYENSPTLIIQGHIDMVCEKNNDTKHDFEKDPIKLLIDGDYIKADGTTLGADNGIAVAYSLALLSDNTIQHPPIEALFTSDEEVGMNGAYALDTSQLKGKMLINIDSEEEGKLFVSCAGGLKASINIDIELEDAPKDKQAFVIKLRGLKGGHSGSEIDKQRANSNKLMGKILSRIYKDFDINISNIAGGAKDNAIPREADAVILVKNDDISQITDVLKQLEKIYKNEFKNCDKDILIKFEKTENPKEVFSKDTLKKIIDILILIPNGVQTISLDIKNLVESSNNLGIVKVYNNKVVFANAVRSSIGSRKDEIKNMLQHLTDLVGGTLKIKAEYPAWEYKENSRLKDVFLNVYKNMYKKEAEIKAIHAGLECGIFSKKISDVDMISFGVDIIDAHTPEERMSISSTARMWDYLISVLKELK